MRTFPSWIKREISENLGRNREQGSRVEWDPWMPGFSMDNRTHSWTLSPVSCLKIYDYGPDSMDGGQSFIDNSTNLYSRKKK